MRSPFRTTPLAALALALVVGACGDDSSGPNPSDVEAGMLVAGSFEIDDFESEASNLFTSLQHVGYSLDTTSATDSTHIAALIAGKDIVFFPDVTPSFDAGTLAILKAFVDGGGTIVLVAGYNHVSWVNTAFGWSLGTDEDLDFRAPMPKTDDAGDTPYGGGPSSIPGNNGGSVLDASTLPDSAIIAYEGENGSNDGSVVVLPSGTGRLVYFAWDWYDATPVGLQDGGWNKLLKLSAGF
jgi:hypothetical protein